MAEYELYHSIIVNKKYGVPEQNKFPLFDLDHVKSAIKFFNYVDPKYEDQLAKAILKRAKEYGLDLSEMSIGDNNKFKKYLIHSELYHSRKGSTWKKHKYISKTNKNGKPVYKYGNSKNIDDPSDWLPVNENDYSELENWLGVDEYDNYKKYKKLEKEASDKLKNETDSLIVIGRYAQQETARYLKEQAETKLSETPIGKVRNGAKYIANFISKPVKRLLNKSK